MKMPTNRTWLQQELRLWAFISLAAIALIGLVIRAYQLRDWAIALAAVSEAAGLIGFFVYGSKELE